MSKEKINAAEIVDLLAQHAAISKKSADDFLKALVTTIEEALTAQESVKINGLGTFKLQWNEPRKSVDVNTGAEITIEGYYKVVFTPDAELKELANEPYAHLQPVLLNEKEGDVVLKSSEESTESDQDTLKHLDEQASEIKDILSEINALNEKNGNKIVDPQKEKTEKKLKEEEKMEKSKLNKEDEIKSENGENLSTDKRKEKLNFLFIGIVAGGLLVYLCFMFDILGSLADMFAPCCVRQETVARSGQKTAKLVSGAAAGSENAKHASKDAVQPDELQRLFDQPRIYKEFIATEKVMYGSRLARISERHYGVKEFWVYIFEANRDRLIYPNQIFPGMRLRIPKLNPKLADVNNPRCMEYALKLHVEYLKIK